MTTLRAHFEHQFAGEPALEAAFEAPPGVTALFGPSGAGKTTTLRILAGLLRPGRGSVSLGHEQWLDTQRGVNRPAQRRSVGYIPQDALLFPHMTVRANLAFGARDAAGAGIDRIAGALELTDLLDRRPAALSGGQRQRVALGRAILRRPRLLLMDEPVSALEADLKRRILDDLCRLVGDLGIPAIFVSHDQLDVRRFAERVVLLDGGRVVGAGPAGETLDRAVGRAGLTTRDNVVRVGRIAQCAGAWHGRLGEQDVTLPAGAWPDEAHVAFGASDVILATSDRAETSVRNRWRGRIIAIDDVGGRIFVAVDVGQPIWAEITPDARAALALAPGAEVVCLVKAAALRRLQGS
ncbi:MAG: molybdenum ABC transporter ATP-binding protein [Phycisphaerales bacterium JB039]